MPRYAPHQQMEQCYYKLPNMGKFKGTASRRCDGGQDLARFDAERPCQSIDGREARIEFAAFELAQRRLLNANCLGERGLRQASAVTLGSDLHAEFDLPAGFEGVDVLAGWL